MVKELTMVDDTKNSVLTSGATLVYGMSPKKLVPSPIGEPIAASVRYTNTLSLIHKRGGQKQSMGESHRG